MTGIEGWLFGDRYRRVVIWWRVSKGGYLVTGIEGWLFGDILHALILIL